MFVKKGGVILKKNATHCILCQICVGPQFQNFMSYSNVASFLGRKAFENLNCYPKINKKMWLKPF